MTVSSLSKLGRMTFLLVGVSGFTSFANADEEIVCRAYKEWPTKEDAFQPCFYLGAGVGLSLGFYKLEFDGDDSKLKPDTGNSSWRTIDDNEIGIKYFAGYNFNKSWFVEGVMADLGKVKLKSAHKEITKLESIHYESTSIFGGYYLPLDEYVYHDWPLKLFVKAGLSYLYSDASSDLVKLKTTNLTSFSSGGGIEWQINQKWMLRAEIESVSADTQLSTLTLAYWLGGKKRYYEVDKEIIPEPPIVVPAPVVVIETTPAENTNTIVMLEAERLDLDKDGIPDEMDTCNNTPIGYVVNAKGCAVYQGVLESVKVEENSTQLSQSSRSVLDEVVSILRKAPDTKVELQGHTDNVGSEAFNQKLSIRRAETVRNYLISKGIAEKRILVSGFGETRPIDTNDSEDGKANNRRVDFKVID